MQPIGYLPASFELKFQRAIQRAESGLIGCLPASSYNFQEPTILTGLSDCLPASFKLKFSGANHRRTIICVPFVRASGSRQFFCMINCLRASFTLKLSMPTGAPTCCRGAQRDLGLMRHACLAFMLACDDEFPNSWVLQLCGRVPYLCLAAYP
jgi:hypothetical protein